MHVEEKHVLEFQRLYKKVFKEDISLDEALEQCIAMVDLNEIVYKPITKEDIEAVIEKYGY